MTLVARGGEPFRALRSLLWAATWGAGAAIGVALGGWLTLVGGAGAPGIESLDPWADLVLLPLVVFAGVLVVHLGGQLIVASIRGGRADQGGKGDDENPRSSGDGIAG
ncbi:MAG: hypothetical protein U1F44_06345 [Coriobacteriia bacterium]|nr:hypothetical protein [Coriobacteriia bacterium]